MMRSRFVLVLGLAWALASGACASAEENQKVQSNSTVPGITPSNSGPATSSPISNTQVMANGQTVLPQQVDANTVASGDPIMPPAQGRLQKMRTGGESAGSVDAAALALKNARPAPDNSTFATYLTDAGYEVRTFKNNPVILKVEKKIDSNADTSVKVFLRNGQVVQVAADSIPTLSTASAESIARAAGVSAPSAKEPPLGSTGAKKSGN